jgi:hypothetical protein
MRYVVYCDESRHDGAREHPFMAIGGLWLPRERKPEVSHGMRELCRELGLHAEVKWSKTSARCLEAYARLVDYFFGENDLSFRVIVVDQRRVDLAKHHGGDRELGFYKFYYEMLIKWITEGNEYLVLLDFKQNKGSDRYEMLKRVLNNALVGRAWISDLTVIDSHQTPLAQLCDLLTGATAAAWCGCREGSPKAELARHVGERRGHALTIPTAGPGVSKFNVFKIELQQ